MSIFKDDPELLAGYRAGKRDVLGRVYRHYAEGVEKYARALARAAGNAELAQPGAIADLLQEVFMRAFSRAARRDFDGKRDFGPYLMAVARNCFVDAQRARGREILIREEDLAGLIESSPADDEGWCDPKILSVLAQYVAELPPSLRALYEHRYVQGRSQDEASVALGLSRQALRTGEKRLRVGLRKAMARAGISLRDYRNLGADLSTKIPTRPVLARSQT